MLYNLFLVEDEIITRDGIRDSIDWGAAGYHFCGEAPDGEIALPLILERRPEVVITDIKMPFMDGLQLCRLLKSSLPETKIIILSGHDEFKYAQEAIQIGVTEYLLKPVSAQELTAVLQKVAQQISAARQESERMQVWQSQMADHRTMMREHCLLNLVMGLLSPTDIIQQSHSFGLDLLARCYQVMVIRATQGRSASQTPLNDSFEAVDAIITEVLGTNETIVRFKKAPTETILILKGHDLDELETISQRLACTIRQRIEQHTPYRATIGIGQPTERLGTIAHSFSQAVIDLDGGVERTADAEMAHPARRTDLAKPNMAALAQFLRSGVPTDFEHCFASYLAPLGTIDHESRVLIDYIFTDVVLLVANFLREIGGEAETLLRDLEQLEAQLGEIHHLDSIKELVRDVVIHTLEYRDQHAHSHTAIITKARAYIDAHYAAPDISLSMVAAQVMLSPSYFSVIFSREVGETFIEYLTRVKISKAKELLRTTSLTSSEIAYQVGYDNPRYFFAVFRKVVGCSPNKFRQKHTTVGVA